MSALSMCLIPCEGMWGDTDTNTGHQVIVITAVQGPPGCFVELGDIGSNNQPDEVFWAVAPPWADVSPLLLPSVRVDLGGAPVGLSRLQGTVIMPHSVPEEWKLASVIRIYRKFINYIIVTFN